MQNSNEKKCLLERVGASGYNFVFYSDSLYCDECARLQNFNEFILTTLKRYGYNTIIFFDYSHGLYCLDENSWRNWASILLGNSIIEKKKKRVTSVRDIREMLGRTSSKDAAQEDNSTQDDELDWNEQVTQKVQFIKDIHIQSIHEQVLWINQLLKLSDNRFSVAIVANSELLSKSYGNNGASDDEFDKAIADWSINHLSLAMFIWCFNQGSAQVTYNTIKSQGEDNRLLSSRIKIFRDLETLGLTTSLDNPRSKTIVELLLPSKLEFKNYLNRMRIIEVFSFDIFELDALAECLFYISKEKHCTLADVNIELSKIPEKELSLEIIKKHFNIQDIKTGEQQLNELIGMEEIKSIISKIKEQYRMNKVESKIFHSRLEGLDEIVKITGDKLHFLLKGNPGTGKTTVAKLLGRTLNEMGVLSSGHVVKCPSSYFSSSHYGDTARKVAEKVDEALGGVLFIDDIASFLNQHKATIDEFNGVLLDAMTTYTDLCIIIAGYPNAVDKYVHTDQGLARRFSIEISLKDYTSDELTQIFELMAKKDGFELDEELRSFLTTFFEKMYLSFNWRERQNWGNAGVAELLFNEIRRNLGSKRGKVLTKELLPKEFKYNDKIFPIEESDEPISISNKSTVLVPKYETLLSLKNLFNENVDLDIIEEAVISIDTVKQDGKGEGTGFIISPEGYAITAAHVILDSKSIRARVRRKLKYGGIIDKYYECSVIKTNETYDLALIQLKQDDETSHINNFLYIKFASDSQDFYKKLTEVTMVGYPGGVSSNDNVSTFKGRIASCQNNKESGDICLLDIKGIGGNSGSPVINANGEVIGIFLASKTYENEVITEEINYMRPSKYVRILLEDN